MIRPAISWSATLATLGGLLASLLAPMGLTSAAAQEVAAEQRVARIGLLNLARGQILRLFAVNVGVSDPDELVCRVRLGFRDINNQGFSDPDEFRLSPGRGAFADLSGDGISDPEETPVRPEAVAIGSPNCKIVFSVQVIDRFTGIGTNWITDPDQVPAIRR